MDITGLEPLPRDAWPQRYRIEGRLPVSFATDKKRQVAEGDARDTHAKPYKQNIHSAFTRTHNGS